MLSTEYLNDPRMSQSKLKKILDGVEEFKWNLENPREPTEPMILGTVVHLLLLEPHRANIILKKPDLGKSDSRKSKIWNFLMEGKGAEYFPISTKKTKKQEEGSFFEVSEEEFMLYAVWNREFYEYRKNPEGFIFLSEESYQKAHAMADSVRKNSDAVNILDCCESFEQSYFFEYFGLDFKCQVDGVGENFVLDLKTTSCENSDYKIRQEIWNRKYHFQAACYLSGTQKKDYYIIFVRSEPPYAVFPVKLSDEMIDEGRLLLDKACGLYKDCLLNNPDFVADNKLRVI